MLKTKARRQVNNKLVDSAVIYVRNCAKRAIMLTMPRLTSLKALKERICGKMKVDPENQLLFLQGKLIEEENGEIELKDKYIFHLVNLKKVDQPKITLHFRKI